MFWCIFFHPQSPVVYTFLLQNEMNTVYSILEQSSAASLPTLYYAHFWSCRCPIIYSNNVGLLNLALLLIFFSFYIRKVSVNTYGAESLCIYIGLSVKVLRSFHWLLIYAACFI